MNLVTSHLSRLADFSGRENRQPFWLWVLTVYIVQMVLGMLVSIPLTMRMMSAMQPMMGRDQEYLNAHPEIGMQMMTGTMLPFMRDIFIFAGVVGLLHVVLMAAAVVRRLHDTNRSGYWALPSLGIQLLTLAGYAIVLPRFFGMIGQIAAMGPNPPPEAMNAAMGSMMPMFLGIWLLGMIGFVFAIVLFVFLVTRGTIGPNRYGDDLLPPPIVYPPQPQWQPPQQWQQPPYDPPPARIVPGPWDQPPRA